jgi:hypothetical protein
MPIQIDNLKEQYLETLDIFQKLTLPTSQSKEFKSRFNEVKELKDNAIRSTSKVSQDYLLKQATTKLSSIKNELLELKKADEIKKYKDETEKLKILFKDKNLSNKEKKYLAKKAGEINGFNSDDWSTYLKGEAKIFSQTITQDINTALMSGL